MRQIKFRGKRNDQDEWVFGDLIEENGGDTYIVQANIIQWKQFEVDPDTVSQFTGLTDRNGKDIYEGDILETKYEDKCEEGGFGIARNGVSFKIGCFGTIGEITREFLVRLQTNVHYSHLSVLSFKLS